MGEGRRAALRACGPGVGMIAVTFGLARYGYGLLLPDMRLDLSIDARAGGVIASGSYLSYLLGNAAVPWLTSRFGPSVPLATATASAASGMALIATARGPLGLATGVFVAGLSAGLAFPPYADIVARVVAPPRRPVVWSAISSGTGWGVALAGPVAIAIGARWRIAWLVFAGLAVLVGVIAVLAAPRRATAPLNELPRLRWSWVICPRSRPLLLSALLVGAGSSVWWTFSVDVLRAAGLPELAARAVFVVCGGAGIVASATGTVARRVGLRRSYLATCAVLVASLALLGLGGASLTAALVAATLFGASYNGVVTVQGLWNAEVFGDRPSAGLAAVNTALTAGTITGPAVAGVLVHGYGYGYGVTLCTAAAVSAVASVHRPSEINIRRDAHR